MICQVIVNACNLLFERVSALEKGQGGNPPTVKQFVNGEV